MAEPHLSSATTTIDAMLLMRVLTVAAPGQPAGAGSQPGGVGSGGLPVRIS